MTNTLTTTSDDFTSWRTGAEYLTRLLSGGAVEGIVTALTSPPPGSDPSHCLQFLSRLWRDLQFGFSGKVPYQNAESILVGRLRSLAEQLAPSLHERLGQAITEALLEGGQTAQPFIATAGLPGVGVMPWSEAGSSNAPQQIAITSFDLIPEGHLLRQRLPREWAWLSPWDRGRVVLLGEAQQVPAFGPVGEVNSRWAPAPFYELGQVLELTRSWRAPQMAEEHRLAAVEREREAAAAGRQPAELKLAALQAELKAAQRKLAEREREASVV